MKRIPFGLALAPFVVAATFAGAAGAQTFEFNEPESEAGEIELQINNGFALDEFREEDAEEGATRSAHEIELQIGVTDYWSTAFAFEIENNLGGGARTHGFEWENIFVLYSGEGDDDDDRPYGAPQDDGLRLKGFGLIASYEIPEEGGVNQSAIEVGPLVSIGAGPLNLISHALFEFPVGDDAVIEDDEEEERNIGFSYALSAMVDLREGLSVGGELHGEIENVFEKETEESYYFGPAMTLEFTLVDDVRWRPHFAMLFGDGEAETDAVFVFNSEFEF